MAKNNNTVGVRSNDMVKIITTKGGMISHCDGNANGVLAKIWRRILNQYRPTRDPEIRRAITVTEFYKLRDSFVEEEIGPAPENSVDKHTISSSIMKEFSRPSITWPVFIKGLKFLQVHRANLTVTIEFSDGRKLVLDQPILFKNFSQEELEEIYKTGLAAADMKKQSDGYLISKRKMLMEELERIDNELTERKSK